MRFRIQGLGFRVQSVGFRIQSLGLRVQSSGLYSPFVEFSGRGSMGPQGTPDAVEVHGRSMEVLLHRKLG